MKNVLITGATGFLGGYILEILNRDQAFKISTLSRSNKKLLKQYPELKHYEVNQMDQIPFSEFDCVIHSAFARAHKEGKEISDSLFFTKKLYDKIAEGHVNSVINISSQAVYGDTSRPWKEIKKPKPVSIYGCAKYFTEMLTDDLRNIGIYGTNLRIAGIIGQNTENRMVNKLVEKAIKGEPITIIGGSQIFSQIDINDAVEGILCVLKMPKKSKRKLYNLGYEKSYSINEIVNLISETTKEFNLPPLDIKYKQKETEIYSDLDSSLLYKDAKWVPRWNMRNTIEAIFKYKLKDEC